MKPEYTDFLKTVLETEGFGVVPTTKLSAKLLRKVLAYGAKYAQQNPLDNSMWSTLLDSALKGLEMVAIGSLDWKLTAIVKLFQSWLKDRREEQQLAKQQADPSNSYNFDTSYNFQSGYY